MSDKFYTKPAIATMCTKYIKNNIPTLISFETDLIIEPSAGQGAFFEGIKTLAKMAIYYDIEPNHKSIKRVDFLKYDFHKVERTFLSGLWYDYVHVIGCPPFGDDPDYSLATQFIENACTFAKTVSFILPTNIRRDIFPSNYTCVFAIDLPKNSFMMTPPPTTTTNEMFAVDYDIDAVFGIWVRKD